MSKIGRGQLVDYISTEVLNVSGFMLALDKNPSFATASDLKGSAYTLAALTDELVQRFDQK